MGKHPLTVRRILAVAARLKWTLVLRYFSKQWGNAVATVIGLLVLSGLAVAGGVFLLVICRQQGHGFRDLAMLWVFWLLSIGWVAAPFLQFDAQRNLDLNGFRLLPVGRSSFTLVVLVDSVLSPAGVFYALLTVLALAAFSLTWLDLALVLTALSLLWVCLLSLGQAVFLWANQLLQSRRFTDASIIIGIVVFFAAQSVNLLVHSGDELALPGWVAPLLVQTGQVLKPVVTLLFPGAAAGLVRSVSAGQLLVGLGYLGALAAQAAACWFLARSAVRQFYEGELESGGSAKPQVRKRRAGAKRGEALVGGGLGALFHRERLYLWRDPTMKMVQLQSMFSAVYMVVLALIFKVNASGSLAFMQQQSGYVILVIALMIGFMESALLFNKFGAEGNQLTTVLTSPIDRVVLLRSKSLYAMVHFGGVNALMVIALGVMLRAGLEFVLAGLVIVVANTAVVDVIGHFVSIYFPFGYARRGRRMRAVMPQPGCGYAMLYTFVFQAANLVVLPVSLSVGLGVVFQGWAGLAGGFLVAVLMVTLAYFYGLPLAARHLLRREPELIAALTRNPD